MGLFELEMRDGIQLFNIDYNVLDDEKLKNNIKAIKLVIKSAFGGNKTYINQIMFYENTLQEIKAHETIQSTNTFKQEINLPEDLTNSNISLEENSQQQINNENNNMNNNIRKINNNNKKKKSENEIINGTKTKKHNIIDFISETNSKTSERKIINKDKKEDIKIEENNIIYNGNTSKNNNIEEVNDNYNDNKNYNDEENRIITTSEGFQNSYMENIDMKSFSRKNEDEYYNQDNPNLKNKNLNENYNNKKVQKLEKILKQKILKNDDISYINNKNRTQDYFINNNNIKDFPNFTPIIKNNNYNLDNQSNVTEQESNFENEEYTEKNNTIQKYFQINKINANTPGRFNINGYDYLMNKRRPTTPKQNEIYLNQNNNKLRNKTLQNFTKHNLNKTDINSNKAYETLEYQLNDMEQHLQKMALNSDMLLPNNNNNENILKSQRTQSYITNNQDINFNTKNKKQINNNSVISNATSYMNEDKNNINNLYNNTNNNNNYFTNYKNNNDSQYGNTYYRDRDESKEINERIDNLEKNIYEIKNEINNISSGIKLFLDKDYFLYNFKDSIKQICYDFFSEKINNENINQTRNENNENEEQDNSKENSEFSESKNLQNNNNINEKGEIEEKINKKIDEKLDYLCNNLKNQIFEKYLQPSINEIESSMKQNIEDIKKKVDTLNYSNENNTNDINTNNTNEYINGEDMVYSNYEGSIDKKNKQRKKYEEINRLGEKLYDKLMEKEKKLKLLKQETTKLLNGKSMDNNYSN